MSNAQHCNGCGEMSPMTMQCPLCQAEGTDKGFFCSQSCFASNWLAHRDSAHKKVTKEKKRVEMEERQRKLANGELVEADETDATGKKKKRVLKEKKAEPVAPAPLFDGMWKDLPSDSLCHATKTGVIQPQLTAQKMAPRVVVAVKCVPAANPSAPVASSSTTNSTIFNESFAAPAALQLAASVDDATNCSATTMWTALTATANFVAASGKDAFNGADNTSKLVIVAGSSVSAFAAAFALKNAGRVTSSNIELALSAAKAAVSVDPSERANKAPITITTVQVLAAVAGAGKLDAWLANKLMIALPDVKKAEELQTMTTRAIFFVVEKKKKDEAAATAEETTTAASPNKKLAGKKRAKEDDEDEDALTVTHTVAALPVAQVPCPNTVFPISTGGNVTSLNEILNVSKDGEVIADEDDEEKNDDEKEALSGVEAETRKVTTHRRYALCGHHDDQLCHLLNRNDLMQLITYLRALYTTMPPKRFTEVVLNAFIADRGGCVITYHHKYAMILWMSVVSARVNGHTDQGHNFLQTLAKCIIRAANTFPIRITTLPKAKNRFASLQAVLTFLHGTISEALLDQLAAAWDLDEFILGYDKLAFMDGHRKDVVRRLTLNYGVKLENGSEHVKMLIILYHLVCNVCHKYTMTVADLTAITNWNTFFAFHFGTIATFIATAELTAGNATKNNAASLLSRKSKKEKEADAATASISAVAASLTPTTFLKPSAHQQNLPFERVPVHLRFAKQNEAMARAAVDEILSAMPKIPIPMFIGDVGQLIGIWPKFNARFGGKLGYKLSDFLQQFPDKFRVVDNLVTRLQESVSEPIRIRFDNEIEEDSDDEGGRTKIGGKTLHRKAKKRNEKKDRNKARYNKNHQQFDPSAKVPGYTKPKPRKVKGRGKKPNIRRFKREA